MSMQTVNCNSMSKQQLLEWIDQVSFAVTELALFLDTHCDDEEALKCFDKFNKERQEALMIYNNLYGPLIMDTIHNSDSWCWASTPWPWEGEC